VAEPVSIPVERPRPRPGARSWNGREEAGARINSRLHVFMFDRVQARLHTLVHGGAAGGRVFL
jgi:hypothetical protein